jgi:hypothetical protein
MMEIIVFGVFLLNVGYGYYCTAAGGWGVRAA